MDNGAIFGFVALCVAALVIDALVASRPGKWKAGPASAQDVARIVSGGKPGAETRDGLKLGLLAVVVMVLWVMFGS